MLSTSDWVINNGIRAVFAIVDTLVTTFQLIAINALDVTGKNVIKLLRNRQKIFKVTWVFDTLEDEL